MSKLVTPRRTGYALLWVIMMVAVIAALVAASAPSLATIDQRSRAVRTAAQLKAISNAFVTFDSIVGNYPGNISELTNTLTTSHRNSCRGAMTTTNVANWTSSAPFADFYVSPLGQWTDLGRVRDSIPARINPPGKTPIYLEIPGANAADATMLQLIVDDGTADTVSFAPPVNDTTTIRYRLLSSGVVINNRC